MTLVTPKATAVGKNQQQATANPRQSHASRQACAAAANTHTYALVCVCVQHSFLLLEKSESVYLSNSADDLGGEVSVCWALEGCCVAECDRFGVNTCTTLYNAAHGATAMYMCYVLHAEAVFVAAKVLNKHANIYAFYFSTFLLATLLFCFWCSYCCCSCCCCCSTCHWLFVSIALLALLCGNAASTIAAFQPLNRRVCSGCGSPCLQELQIPRFRPSSGHLRRNSVAPELFYVLYIKFVEQFSLTFCFCKCFRCILLLLLYFCWSLNR